MRINNRLRTEDCRVFLADMIRTSMILLLATVITELTSQLTGSSSNVSFVYILAVSLVSLITSGYFWGIAASLGGVVAFNFFFTYPYHQFHFTMEGYPVLFFIMLLISVIISTLTTRLKRQAQLADKREQRTRELYYTIQKLLLARGEGNIIDLTLSRLYEFSGRPILFYRRDESKELDPAARTWGEIPQGLPGNPQEWEAAKEAFRDGHRTGLFTKRHPGCALLYLPVSSHGHRLGVVGLLCPPDAFPDDNTMNFWETMISQMAIAMERQQLSDRQRRTTMEKEKEQMRSNLLRAISHDLRTPLTSILGASSAILENMGRIDPSSQEQLIRNIHGDAQWLLQMVENLLSVTRIGEGAPALKKRPEAVEEIAAEAAGLCRKRLPNAQFRVRVPDDLLMVPMDAMLIEQVLVNLMENAVRHGGSESPVEVRVTEEAGFARFSVRDHGRGIAPEELPVLFDGFAAKERLGGDSTRGLGLGLSICRTIVQAHGGVITGGNHPEGGALFSFTLPLEPQLFAERNDDRNEQ